MHYDRKVTGGKQEGQNEYTTYHDQDYVENNKRATVPKTKTKKRKVNS